MKNIVSTIIIFGSIFILIVAGAFVFDKFNGFGLIDNVDSSLNSGIKKILENEEENFAKNKVVEKEKREIEKSYINDNISDNASDNSSYKSTVIINDNKSGNVVVNNIIDDNTTK